MLRRLFYYFTSKKYRECRELWDAVHKVVELQREDLSPRALADLDPALEALDAALKGPKDTAHWDHLTVRLNEAAEKWLKAFPHASLREYTIMGIELVILVLGSRAFLIQPMEIPTGSAQPTLWGITHDAIPGKGSENIPSWPVRLWDLFIKGDAYCVAEAAADGVLERVDRPHTFIPLVPFCNRATIVIGGVQQTLYFVPDDYGYRFGLTDYAQDNRPWTPRPITFHKGDTIARYVMHSGDHLFVERVTYNFRRPERGETIVFRSEHHPGMTPRTHYIKRLVGLGGETVSIGDDRHTYINGRPLTTNDSGFEKVYSFDPALPPRKDHYSGHVNEHIARTMTGGGVGALNFPDQATTYAIPPGEYVCFGDNTMNSADSRYWGRPSFPQERVIGKALFVFWPFTERFGWSRH